MWNNIKYLIRNHLSLLFEIVRLIEWLLQVRYRKKFLQLVIVKNLAIYEFLSSEHTILKNESPFSITTYHIISYHVIVVAHISTKSIQEICALQLVHGDSPDLKSRSLILSQVNFSRRSTLSAPAHQVLICKAVYQLWDYQIDLHTITVFYTTTMVDPKLQISNTWRWDCLGADSYRDPVTNIIEVRGIQR